MDDVFSGEGGRFSVRASMRYELHQENQRVQQQASEISETAEPVFSYLRETHMLDRAGRFVAFPVKVCGAAGSCQALPKSDTRLRQALLALKINHLAVKWTDLNPAAR